MYGFPVDAVMNYHSIICLKQQECIFSVLGLYYILLIWYTLKKEEMLNLFLKSFLEINWQGVPIVVQQKQIHLVSMRIAGSIPGLTQWVRDLALPWTVV